jgi:uncharacterized protein YecE (DUF72 family)
VAAPAFGENPPAARHGWGAVEILIGTSGYSYAEWKGNFYPRTIKQPEMLAYYSRRFPVVEINSSYYGVPKPERVARMVEDTPPEFRFVIKTHQDMTHNKEVRAGGGAEAFPAFRDALKPLVEAGKLGAVLAQFPWSFRRRPENERYLFRLREELHDCPVVIELRNSEWADEDCFDLLRSLDFGFCCVDEPRFSRLMPPIAIATSRIGYVRFHGRNSSKWEHHPDPDERYNYLYTMDQLREWVPKIVEVAEQTDTTYVVYNNHQDGKSTINAQQMADLLNLTLPLDGQGPSEAGSASDPRAGAEGKTPSKAGTQAVACA